MSEPPESRQQIRAIAASDGRFQVNAYLFTIEALNIVLDGRRRLGLRGHVDGAQVLEGIRKLARERFGWLGAAVLNGWGLKTPRHFGDIVFNLVEAGILSKQEQDSPEDFAEAWTFEEVFESSFLPTETKKA